MDPKNWALDRPRTSRPAPAGGEPAKPAASSSVGSFSFKANAHPGGKDSGAGAARAPLHRVHSAGVRSDEQSGGVRVGVSGAGGSGARHMTATVSSSALGSAIAAAWLRTADGEGDDAARASPVDGGNAEQPKQPPAAWESSRASRGSQGGQGLQSGYTAEDDDDDGYVQEDTGGDHDEEAEDAEAGYGEATLGRGFAACGKSSAISAASGRSHGSASASRHRGLSGDPSGGGKGSRSSAAAGDGDGDEEHHAAGTGHGSESVSEAEVDEADPQTRSKHMLAAQGMLPAAELAPEEWARIGPPQDAADASQFVARSYTVEIDMEPQTYVTKRVARPDIWHISKDEMARRQATKEAVAFAMQAERRKELEQIELQAERERLARSTSKGPRYNEFGVFLTGRPKSPVRPRYLDWHPHCVGGLAHKERLAAEAEAERRRRPPGSGGGSAAGSRVPSALPPPQHTQHEARGRSLSAATTMAAHLPASRFHGGSPAALGHDDFVIEDTSEGPSALEGFNTSGGGPHGGRRRGDLNLAATASAGVSGSPPRASASAGIMRPLSPMSRQRRVQSAIVGPHSLTPQPKPAEISEVYYAQMLREQRKWLNSPVQPSRPASAAVAAAPPPKSRHYVRPVAATPAPQGTAPPVPSRVAAAEAAAAAAAAAAARPSSALRTVLHPRPEQSPYAASANAHATRSRPQSAAGGAARPWSASSRPPATLNNPGPGGWTQHPDPDRLPWEPREDVVSRGGSRPQSAGQWSYGPGGRRSRPASAGPIARERSVVEGEMLPRADGAGDGSAVEKSTPRKFAFADESQMYGQMVQGYKKR
ncbi:hypothetical protein HYH02_013593 [Chlamydomonas schloesseri]|uniref:Uncharacterized protein n=1 Tax=Chlamydomonas schloesseri TaxID=2026947 RepID=A0A835VYX6_9CHLO|nr:hypothetical protein HYH02_013593 [Chlamydomonas schloesseri]|eukprot:KAG2430754.1 hypothetical protein HYH02_013593 [Chlamydomonas schloesseri]